MKSDYERKQYHDAVQAIHKDGKASTIFLVQRLQIGYTEAALLMGHLEANGIISKPDRAGKRTVL